MGIKNWFKKGNNIEKNKNILTDYELDKIKDELKTTDDDIIFSYLNPLYSLDKTEKDIARYNLIQLGISKTDMKELIEHKKKNPNEFIIKKYKERLKLIKNKNIQRLKEVLSGLIEERKISNLNKIVYEDLIFEINKRNKDLYIYMTGKTSEEKREILIEAIKYVKI